MSKYSRMDPAKLVEDRLWKLEVVWSAQSKPYPVKFFKDCLPQILHGPFLNTLSHIIMQPEESSQGVQYSIRIIQGGYLKLKTKK